MVEEENTQVQRSDSSKSDEARKITKDQKSPDDALEESTKDSTSTSDSSSQERSPLHTAKPCEKPDQQSQGKHPKDSKKSKLRKGKWTVEEEQYTAHIIKCFNDGLLTLPEGSTLRGYLADRLNCNPMRITKKFTGACGLTRRVYHLHDRRNASPADVERAKAELNHLEQRFRMRVEQEQSGLPLTHKDGMFPHSQVQSGISPSIPLHHHAPATYLNPWAQSLPDMSTSQLLLGLPGGRQLLPCASNQYPFSSHLGHWMPPNPADPISTASNPGLHHETSAHFIRSLMTSYLAQVAAASMASPSALLLQQQQHHQPQISKIFENTLQLQRVGDECREGRKNENVASSYEEASKPKPTARTQSSNQPKKLSSAEDQIHAHLSPVQQLQRGYEAHLQSLRKSNSIKPEFVDDNIPKARASPKKIQVERSRKEDKVIKKTQGTRTDDEEGTILLLDFMKSAQRACGDPPSTRNEKSIDKPPPSKVQRDGHYSVETTITERANELGMQSSTNSEQEKKYRMQPVAVTDTSTSSRSETSSRTSSQPTESSSSIEDSDSKSDKTDPSSGEESEKESLRDVRYRVPPRKRLKTDSSVREFTAQNLAEHSRMMAKRNASEDTNSEN